MVTIELQNLRLQAYHGIYDGEINTGSPYEVNVKVIYQEGTEEFDKLKNTINYVEVFDIVKKRMSIPTPLLEKVGDSIIQTIKQQFPFTREIIVSIYKLEPPIENFQGKIGVTMHKQYNE